MTEDTDEEGLSLARLIHRVTAYAQHNSPLEVAQGLSHLSRLLFRTPCSALALYSLLRPLISSVFTLSDRIPRETQPALAELEEVLDFLPTSLSASLAFALYDRLGRGYRETGELRLAAYCYEKAIRWPQEASNEVQTFEKLCETYREMGKWKQAVRYGNQAVTLLERDLKAIQPDSEDYNGIKTRVQSLYFILTECENRLNRSDNALFWVRRSLNGILALSPSAPHNSSPEDQSPALLPSLGSSISQAPYLSKSESMDGFWSDSLDNSYRLWSPPLFSLYSKQTGSTDSPADKDLPFSEEDSPGGGGRRHVSLRIRSRQHTETTKAVEILQETWKTLETAGRVRVKVEAKGEEWVLSAWGTSPPLSVEVSLAPSHPWRQFDPESLISRLELSPTNELILTDSPAIPPSLQPSRSPESSEPLITLYEENRLFEGVEYAVKYSTVSSLANITIRAKGGNRTIRKVILNDIHLSTLSRLSLYAKDVIAPQLLISAEKIKLRPTTDGGELQLELTTTKALSSDITAEISVKSPISLYRNWVLEAKTEQSTLRLEVGDREVKQVTGGAQGREAAEKLVDMLMLEGGSGLTLRKRQYLSGYCITIDPADPNKKHHSYLSAVLTLQRWYRSHLASSLYVSLRKRNRNSPGKTIQRYGVLLEAEYWVVTVKQDREQVRVRGEQLGSDRRVEMVEEVGRTDWKQERQRREAANRLLGKTQSPQLLLTRLQRIKGRNYQISVYSLKGKVEIRASKLT